MVSVSRMILVHEIVLNGLVAFTHSGRAPLRWTLLEGVCGFSVHLAERRAFVWFRLLDDETFGHFASIVALKSVWFFIELWTVIELEGR
jgi:hypothetical protein